MFKKSTYSTSCLFLCLSICMLLATTALAAKVKTGTQSIHDFQVNSLAGAPVKLSTYKNKVLLIVNTASKCGLTPQYEGLQNLHQKYNLQGFEVLAFPSNDFGGQEPGSATEIKNFCDLKFKVKFPLFEKNPVTGPHKQALYAWLIDQEPLVNQQSKGTEVSWNFEKFLIGRDGKVVARFLPKVTPESPEVVAAIEKALQKK